MRAKNVLDRKLQLTTQYMRSGELQNISDPDLFENLINLNQKIHNPYRSLKNIYECHLES
jgi:hypothetical protein